MIKLAGKLNLIVIEIVKFFRLPNQFIYLIQLRLLLIINSDMFRKYPLPGIASNQ